MVNKSTNFHYIYDDNISELKPNTLYCMSPDNTLLHAEQIRDVSYNKYINYIQIKINKFIEKKYIASKDFSV